MKNSEPLTEMYGKLKTRIEDSKINEENVRQTTKQ